MMRIGYCVCTEAASLVTMATMYVHKLHLGFPWLPLHAEAASQAQRELDVEQ